ncbi:MAG: GGDEF domain-containing protein [Methylococcales bacterium]|jgi:diguanylate cyclase|nr:GGDEF domain-containing protein [Methylococcales bacterium]
MTTDIDFHKVSIQRLKKILPLMGRFNIPTTPENYAVWYEYSLNRTPALNKKIDKIKTQANAFTNKVNNDLYVQFVANQNSEALEHTEQNIRHVIKVLNHNMDKMYQGAEHYTDFLANVEQELSAQPEAQRLSELIINLISETTTLKASNLEMTTSLKKVQDIVDIQKEDPDVTAAEPIDKLTGLMSQHTFHKHYVHALEDFAEADELFGLLIIDIDHFSHINKTYHSIAGDKILKFVAKLLTDSVKGQDVVARYEKDQFVILLPRTSYQNTLKVGTTLCANIGRKKLTLSKKSIKLGGITVSVGVSGRKYNGTDVLLEANTALKHAKTSGGNQVAGYFELDLPEST